MRTSATPPHHSLEARERGCGSEDATCQSFQRNTIKWASASSSRMSLHHCLPLQTFRGLMLSDAKTVILPQTQWVTMKSFILKINALIMSNISYNVCLFVYICKHSVELSHCAANHFHIWNGFFSSAGLGENHIIKWDIQLPSHSTILLFRGCIFIARI